MITYKLDKATIYRLASEHAEPLEPDRSKPFSTTRRVWSCAPLPPQPPPPLRGGQSRGRPAQVEVLPARSLHSYQAASYWVRFQFPFWWNNLVAALDSISLIDQARDEPMEPRDYLADRPPTARRPLAGVVRRGSDCGQCKDRRTRLWVTLAICRVLRRVNG